MYHTMITICRYTHCPHMVKGRKYQKVSCEQWTVKGFKILIKRGFKYFLKLLAFLFVHTAL